jgi:hypothetical protein
MQRDGNLVEYGPHAATVGGAAYRLPERAVPTGDADRREPGRLHRRWSALWQSGTGGQLNSAGFVLDLQNDSNLVIYGVGNLGALWSREGTLLTFGHGLGPEGRRPPTSTTTGTTGIPYRDPPACTDGGACLLGKWDFYQGQCTSWVAYRLSQLNGIGFSD